MDEAAPLSTAQSPTAALDFRSDVLSGPTDAMWDAMRSVERGWATFGDDRTVVALEARGAAVLGKEAALLVPTCSMANLVALLTLAERGTQVVVENTAHVITSEAYGLVALAGVFPRLLPGQYGRLAPADVAHAIEAAEARHLPRTSLVWLENTHTNAGGEAMDAAQTAALAEVAHRSGAAVYLDGARLPNAAAALGLPLAELAAPADAVAISLNKGLGAPFGALLAGSGQIVERARGALKQLGGASLHNAGLLAAAGILALSDAALARVTDDNGAAARLAARLAAVPGLTVLPARIRTNIVLADTSSSGRSAAEVLAALERAGVRAFPAGPRRVRFVTHRLTGPAEVERAACAVEQALADLSNLVYAKG